MIVAGKCRDSFKARRGTGKNGSSEEEPRLGKCAWQDSQRHPQCCLPDIHRKIRGTLANRGEGVTPEAGRLLPGA